MAVAPAGWEATKRSSPRTGAAGLASLWVQRGASRACCRARVEPRHPRQRCSPARRARGYGQDARRLTSSYIDLPCGRQTTARPCAVNFANSTQLAGVVGRVGVVWSRGFLPGLGDPIWSDPIRSGSDPVRSGFPIGPYLRLGPIRPEVTRLKHSPLKWTRFVLPMLAPWRSRRRLQICT